MQAIGYKTDMGFWVHPLGTEISEKKNVKEKTVLKEWRFLKMILIGDSKNENFSHISCQAGALTPHVKVPICMVSSKLLWRR